MTPCMPSQSASTPAWKALQSLNDLTRLRLLFAGDALLVPRLDKTEAAAYLIKPGDSLFRIARRFDTTVAALQSLNGIGDRDHILSGQTIRLPQSAGSAMGRGFALRDHAYSRISKARRTSCAGSKSSASIGPRSKSNGPTWNRPQAGFAFDDLDALIAGLDQLGIQILLNVYAAPEWSRRSYTRN